MMVIDRIIVTLKVGYIHIYVILVRHFWRLRKRQYFIRNYHNDSFIFPNPEPFCLLVFQFASAANTSLFRFRIIIPSHYLSVRIVYKKYHMCHALRVPSKFVIHFVASIRQQPASQLVPRHGYCYDSRLICSRIRTE